MHKVKGIAVILVAIAITVGCSNESIRQEDMDALNEVIRSQAEEIAVLKDELLALEEENVALNNALVMQKSKVSELTIELMETRHNNVSVQQEIATAIPESFTKDEILSDDPLVELRDISFTVDHDDYIRIALSFMEEYAQRLLDASEKNPLNPYGITDHKTTVSPSMSIQKVEGGVQLSFNIEFEIKPREEFLETTPWWAGNTVHSPTNAGWLSMSRILNLELSDNGLVTFGSIITGW